MTDIVERAREYAGSDHERGCAGRCYECTCGYGAKRDLLIVELADEIGRLRSALAIQYGMQGDLGKMALAIRKEAAAFLDGLARRLDAMLDVGATHDTGIAPDIDRAGDECRAMAKKLRGET
jgi:hypothetical protein